MVSGDVVCQVIDHLRRNASPYNGLERCYVSEIARNLDISRRQAHRAVDLLDEYGLVERKAHEQKKLVVIKDIDGPDPKKHHPWAR